MDLHQYHTSLEQCYKTERYCMINRWSENIIRKKALHVIQEYSKSDNFDAFIPYLAMYYFDSFQNQAGLITLHELTEDVTILALCCLIFANKMIKRHSFNVYEFLTKKKLKIGKYVRNVEYHILHKLQFQISPVTPFCYVRFFVERFPIEAGSIRTINEIIIQGLGDITFTGFRPSVIAAAAVHTAFSRPFPSIHGISSDYSDNEITDIFSQAIGLRHLPYDTLNETRSCIRETVDFCLKKGILKASEEVGETNFDLTWMTDAKEILDINSQFKYVDPYRRYFFPDPNFVDPRHPNNTIFGKCTILIAILLLCFIATLLITYQVV